MDSLALWFGSFKPETLNWHKLVARPSPVALGTAEGQALGTIHTTSTGKWGGNVHPYPMACSSSSPQQLRWAQVKLPHSRARSELGLDRDGLQKWAVLNWPSAEPVKPSRDAGMEQLKLPQAPPWAWPCHRARAERGFEHLITTQHSNCCYCTGSAFDQFYCLKPSLLWQTLNIPRARAALASQNCYTTLWLHIQKGMYQHLHSSIPNPQLKMQNPQCKEKEEVQH